MTVLVDSNVCIDHLRELPSARALIRRLRRRGPVRASILTRAELRAGSQGRSSETEELIEALVWEPVTEDVADRAGELVRTYRPSHPGIGLIDFLVAATADVLGLELVTRNVRHFPMFPDLEPPY